jgi:hypothetical protein
VRKGEIREEQTVKEAHTLPPSPPDPSAPKKISLFLFIKAIGKELPEIEGIKMQLPILRSPETLTG